MEWEHVLEHWPVWKWIIAFSTGLLIAVANIWAQDLIKSAEILDLA